MLCVLVIFVDYSVCLHHHLQDGRTPLEEAKQRGHQSVVDYLVTVGEYYMHRLISLLAYTIHVCRSHYSNTTKAVEADVATMMYSDIPQL